MCVEGVFSPLPRQVRKLYPSHYGNNTEGLADGLISGMRSTTMKVKVKVLLERTHQRKKCTQPLTPRKYSSLASRNWKRRGSYFPPWCHRQVTGDVCVYAALFSHATVYTYSYISINVTKCRNYTIKYIVLCISVRTESLRWIAEFTCSKTRRVVSSR